MSLRTTITPNEIEQATGIPRNRVSCAKSEGRLSGEYGVVNIDRDLIHFMELQLKHGDVDRHKIETFVATHKKRLGLANGHAKPKPLGTNEDALLEFVAEADAKLRDMEAALAELSERVAIVERETATIDPRVQWRILSSAVASFEKVDTDPAIKMAAFDALQKALGAVNHV